VTDSLREEIVYQIILCFSGRKCQHLEERTIMELKEAAIYYIRLLPCCPGKSLSRSSFAEVMLAKSQGLRTVRKVLSLACNLTSNVAEDPDFIFTVTCILLSSDSSQSMRGNPQRSRHICIATKVI
jgi:hypothetical protein